MPEKIKVGLIFGGNSSEYEVSIQSGHNIYEAIDCDKYDVYPLGFTKQGYLASITESKKLLNDPTYQVKAPYEVNNIENIAELGEIANLDVFFPIVHGNLGEDGALQGLFRILDKPFVGADVLSAAVTMDKDFSKILAQRAGLQVADWITIKRVEYEDQSDKLNYQKVAEKLGKTLFIKPSNQGSSVGINRAQNAQEYAAALADAFKYDDKVLVEEAIDGVEIECAVLGNSRPVASGVGEITTKPGDFYTYENKYLDETGATLTIPAKISDEIADAVRQSALKAYEILEVSGFARVDFMLTNQDQQIVFNELNAIPGFTNISMYPKLFEKAGIAYSDLIDQLIQLALAQYDHKHQLRHSR